MQIIKYPERKEWKQLLQRPYSTGAEIIPVIETVMEEVQKNGDAAVLSFIKKFDGISLDHLQVSDSEIRSASEMLSTNLKNAIQLAYQNIEKFHSSQIQEEQVVETMPGVRCSRKSIAIEKVGLYIPGGTAPLFSTVLMLGIPAKIAGCKEMVLCTPCNMNGEVHPPILYSAQLVGINKIFKAGGAQAIAAMSFGTESIPSVYKIFGPGNQYVTAAKQWVQMRGIAIDMPAGPSEVCIMVDSSAEPSFVAADLLSQAEHGLDSQVLLVSSDLSMINSVLEDLSSQIELLPRKNIASKALENSKAILVNNIDEAIDLVNDYAAEHLIIACTNASEIAQRIINAGSVFIGNYSPESAGDYASGTNHTLPTNGFAKAYSGLSVDSFVKKITYQELTREGLKALGSAVIEMAEAEGLQAHAEAVRIRMNKMMVDNINQTKTSHDLTEDFDVGTFDLDLLVRQNIKELQPYSSARNEYSGQGKIFLDANENSIGSPLPKWYNRYPDPMQWELKKKIATIKNVAFDQILLGNGSDECIDLLIRAFCNPQKDNIIIFPPTYGMYQVCAQINDVQVKEVNLTPTFQLDLEALEQAIDGNTKILFFCSPNNPTGNSMSREDLELVLNNFNGLVVVDEAYINFSRYRSLLAELKYYPNLVVLQTLSKAWGLAGLRLGMSFASKEIINILNKIKPPYNINEATQELAMKALDHLDDVNEMIREIVKEREALREQLLTLPFVERIYPSEANFLLVKMNDAVSVYEYLKSMDIIVRNRSNIILCENSLRITIGTGSQNAKLIETLKSYNS